ncbi:hypothetical protein R3P38DRAFT_3178152 [Favolaschia claudopus]|uniref:Uncharacterized protein n=1 Tax=Favolaschia claudopus TaxID=2862362 RepID=A0AAW0CWK6_9AGAR
MIVVIEMLDGRDPGHLREANESASGAENVVAEVEIGVGVGAGIQVQLPNVENFIRALVRVQEKAETHRSRRKQKDHDRKRSKSEERERRERKERKRAKKEKKEKKKSKATSQWGKYGIIGESDIFTKGQEFHTWLVEERKINPETISKDQNKKEFAKFMEDYNTATLPDEKYYNMEAYNRRMTALRQGEYADMKAINKAHKKQAVEHDSYLSREQLMELRKVQNERVEVGKMKRLGMDVKANMGVRMDGTQFDD